MNFDFDDQQYEFRDSFARFLAEALPREGHEKRIEEGGAAHERVWRGLAELGLFALLVPEDQGGLGLGFVDLALIVEELGRTLAPLSVTDTLVATDVLVRHGTPDQKARWLPSIAAGDTRIAIAALEPEAGYDPASCVTRVAGGRLSGRKMLVPHAADAALFLVSARSDEADCPTLLLVERGAEGVAVRPHTSLDPSCALAEVTLSDVSVTPGAEVKGALDRWFDASVAVAAALQVGVAGRALDLAVDYAKTRVQFGKPIGSFQAIKHRCADMAVSHDGARAAAYYALWAVAEDSADRGRAASVAKAFCGDAARTICNESIQVHGGMGFTWELGLHHYLRRAKILEFASGDVAFHRERVLALTLAGLDGSHAAEVEEEPASHFERFVEPAAFPSVQGA